MKKVYIVISNNYDSGVTGQAIVRRILADRREDAIEYCDGLHETVGYIGTLTEFFKLAKRIQFAKAITV